MPLAKYAVCSSDVQLASLYSGLQMLTLGTEVEWSVYTGCSVYCSRCCCTMDGAIGLAGTRRLSLSLESAVSSTQITLQALHPPPCANSRLLLHYSYLLYERSSHCALLGLHVAYSVLVISVVFVHLSRYKFRGSDGFRQEDNVHD